MRVRGLTPALHGVAIAGLFAGCGDTGEWCPDGDGATVVMAATPSGWSGRPTLETVWRAGGVTEGQELYVPVNAAVDPRGGRVAVVDFGLGDVVVLGLDGEWIGRWGRRGNGPLEIAGAGAVAWTYGADPNGDGAAELLVFDGPGSKLVHFATTGEATRASPVATRFAAALGGGFTWLSLGTDGSLVAYPRPHGTHAGGTVLHAIIHLPPGGETIDTLVAVPVPEARDRDGGSVALRNWPLPHAAAAGGALAVAAPDGHYRIDMVQGADTTRICRSVAARRSPAPVFGENVPPELRGAIRSAPRPPVPPRIGRLAFDADGRLWVQRDLPRTLAAEDAAIGREGALFDVFDADVAYLGEVLLPARMRFLGATGDLIIALERDTLEVPHIVGLRLSR